MELTQSNATPSAGGDAPGADRAAHSGPESGGAGPSSADGRSKSADPGDANVVAMPVVPKHLSPTGAAMIRQCPQRWKFRYIDNLPDPPGEAAVAGTFAHRVLEALLQLDADERTLDQARSLAREFWAEAEADSEFIALGLDEAGVRNFKWTAWKAIAGLWDLEDPTSVETVGTEFTVSVEIAGVPFHGIIDRVEATAEGLVISDYKSGRAPRTRYAADRLEQVLMYAAALAALEGTAPARVRLLYLGQRIIETEVTAERLDEVTGRLADTWGDLLDRLNTGDFPPKPGPLCGWCAFLEHCPEGQAEVERRHRQGVARPAAAPLAEAV